MDNGQDFIDYYDLLQVSPDCEGKVLEKAYRQLAQRYHPDHRATADVDRFQAVIEAYAVLRDPQRRAAYDRVFAARTSHVFASAVPGEDNLLDEQAALDDAEAHRKILLHLYKRRREHAQEPGVIAFHLQEMLGCSDDTFEFHAWYLKSRGYIELNQQSELTITIAGVDHVIATSRKAEAEKLLLARLDPERG